MKVSFLPNCAAKFVSDTDLIPKIAPQKASKTHEYLYDSAQSLVEEAEKEATKTKKAKEEKEKKVAELVEHIIEYFG